MTTLWKYSHYDANLDFVFDKKIVEYDISKANISVLASYGVIDEKEYKFLLGEDRMVRQYVIGCKIRDDPKISDILKDGIAESRRIFIEKLDLMGLNILHINNDAIFVIWPQYHKAPEEVKISDYIKFTSRGVYSSYYRIDGFRNIHMYYGYSSDKDVCKIRGIGEYALSLHEDYFLRILNNIARVQVTQGVKEAYAFIKDQATILNSDVADYRNFRRFDSQSLFDIKQVSSFSSFQAEYLRDEDKDMVDKTFNLHIIYRIGSMFLNSVLSCI